MSDDMSAVIVPKSDQLNADSLMAGPMTITITSVAISVGQEQPVSMSFGDPDKVYRPCKSMARVLVAAWGPDAKNYTGRSMTLYRDPTVKWGGMDVGGIRISHLSDIPKEMTMALTATRATRKPYTVKPLTRQQPAQAETGRTVPRTPFVTQFAKTWRDRIAEAQKSGDAASLSALWSAPANKTASEKAQREDATVADAVSAEVLAAIAELEALAGVEG